MRRTEYPRPNFKREKMEMFKWSLEVLLWK